MTRSDAPLGTAGRFFAAKFGDDGARRWSTYVGGASTLWEQCTGITVDASLRVHVAGYTQANAEIATPEALDESVAPGDRDGFLVQLSQGLGQACVGPADCANGLCVDGMCCDAACGYGADDCQACSVAASSAFDGVCSWLGTDVTCVPAAQDIQDKTLTLEFQEPFISENIVRLLFLPIGRLCEDLA